MKKTILYAVAAAAIAATAAAVIVGCGDMGSGDDKVYEFLEKFRGEADNTVSKYIVRYDGNGGKGDPPAADTVRVGGKIRLPGKNSLTKEPLVFVGWNTESSGEGNKYGIGSDYTPAFNATLYADWQNTGARYEVTVLSAGAGAYGGSSYQYGETVTIHAGTAPSGQQFTKWISVPAVTFAGANSVTTTFSMPANAVTVTANFDAIPADKYAVTVSSIGVGASSGGSYEAGQTVTVKAGSDPFGHRFKNWTVTGGGVGLSDANSRTATFTMPADAVTVTANFEKVPTYKVTVSSEGVGASKDSSYREGDAVSINAGTALADRRFKNWTTSSAGVTFANANSAATTFTMPPNAVTATANFQANTYTVTVSAGTGASEGGEYPPGATVTVKAGTNPDGVPFMNWTTSNSNAVFADKSSSTTTFVMPSADVTVVAKFGFTDIRDSQKYGVVKIGGKTWMGENLNYQPSTGNSWCYSGSVDNCVKYGRLYDWSTANTVCPVGWHLPTRREWGDLAIAVGGTGDYGASGTAGKKLKSTSGWGSNSSYNVTDDFGFSALPGGRRTDDWFSYAGDYGYGFWWTATELGSDYAYSRDMYYDGDYMDESYDDKSYGFSVRCAQD